jgi:coproporphyrinogen III oxidase-like Fe-S oxidoreductase
MCADSGYQQYEVSTFSKEDKFKSMHNLGYWRGIDYLGVGPGAHGCFKTTSSVIKTFRILDPNRWMQSINDIGHGIKKNISMDDMSISKETMVLGLRTLEGVDVDIIKQIVDYEKTNDLVKLGLLTYKEKGKRLAPTSKGLQLMDSILPVILK